MRQSIITLALTISLVVSNSHASAYSVANNFVAPLIPGGWHLSQNFCDYNASFGGWHLGEDYTVDNGSELPVLAPGNGIIRHSGVRTLYGTVVIIEHLLPDGSYVCSVLSHLKSAGALPVGAEVQAGNTVGYLASQYDENGGYNFTHLHYGVRDGEYSTSWIYYGYGSTCDNWYDPTDFINSHHQTFTIGQGSRFPEAFIAAWQRMNGEAGGWAPSGPVVPHGIGEIQDFTTNNVGDAIITLLDGANVAYGMYGDIYLKYQQMDRNEGVLGYPLTDESDAHPSPYQTFGRFVRCQGGTINYIIPSEVTEGGTFEVHGSNFTYFADHGYSGNSGWTGFPVSDVYSWSGGERTNVEEGGFIFTPAGGATTYEAPTGPKYLIVSSTDGMRANLIWGDNSFYETAYYLIKWIFSPNTKSWNQESYILAANTNSYTDNDITAGYLYRYQVMGQINESYSPPTNEAHYYPDDDGQALSFDGIDDFVATPMIFQPPNSFTMELWANPTNQHQIDQQSNWGVGGTYGQRYAIGPMHGAAWDPVNYNAAGVGISVGTNGVSVYEHSHNYMPPVLVWTGELSNWTHIAIVYNNRVPNLYINGVFMMSGYVGNTANVYPGLAGESIGGCGIYGHYAGQLDEIRIWSYANSEDEIYNRYNRELTESELNDERLLGYWMINEGQGQYLINAVDENNYGRLGNTAGADASDPVWSYPGAPVQPYGNIVDVKPIHDIEYRLESLSPNPDHGIVRLAYTLPDQDSISLRIYDMRGHLVKVLVNGPLPSGAYMATWDGRDEAGSLVASGTYICALSSARGEATRKVTLIR